MKCPKSGEFSGSVNCSHLGVEPAPLKIAYAKPDSPSAERTALRRIAPLLGKNARPVEREPLLLVLVLVLVLILLVQLRVQLRLRLCSSKYTRAWS